METVIIGLILILSKRHNIISFNIHAYVLIPHISDHDFRNSIKFNYNVDCGWQSLWVWTNCNNNKLREIKQTILPWPKPYEMSINDEVIFIRLRIGHNPITHGYLMAREDPPSCELRNTHYGQAHPPRMSSVQ